MTNCHNLHIELPNFPCHCCTCVWTEIVECSWALTEATLVSTVAHIHLTHLISSISTARVKEFDESTWVAIEATHTVHSSTRSISSHRSSLIILLQHWLFPSSLLRGRQSEVRARVLTEATHTGRSIVTISTRFISWITAARALRDWCICTWVVI